MIFVEDEAKKRDVDPQAPKKKTGKGGGDPNLDWPRPLETHPRFEHFSRWTRPFHVSSTCMPITSLQETVRMLSVQRGLRKLTWMTFLPSWKTKTMEPFVTDG
jgi:hypothetical protein